MDKIEEIQIYCQNIDGSTLLDITSRILLKDCKYLLSYISTLTEAIEKHKSLRREKGMLWSSVDEELYRAKDEICGEGKK